jgi:hypothetical protein
MPSTRTQACLLLALSGMLTPLVAAAPAADLPHQAAGVVQVWPCSVAVAAGSGASSNPNAHWVFRASDTWGDQRYVKEGDGPAFAAAHTFQGVTLGYRVVVATLYADGELVAMDAIGCA